MVATEDRVRSAPILGRVDRWTALRDELREHARALGWAALGVTGLEPFTEARERGLDAVASGRMDGMPWMTAERVESSTDLRARYPWARSLVALAWPYRPVRPPDSPGRGRVAAYALLDEGGSAADYHSVLARRCDDLVAWLRGRVPGVRAKRFVDHGWAVDRAIAERAGIGFVGKHASLLTTTAGSYVLLAELALSLPLPPDRRSARNCGTCSACLPACPTGAIVEPGMIDARRCISYLTIEHEGPIPPALRPLIGTWVFGCDLCQEACPINERLAPPVLETTDRSGPVAAPDLVELLEVDEAGFAARYRGTAVARSGRGRLARNAAIALGNAGDTATLPALRRAVDADPDPVVRDAAAWAIERIEASEPLRRRASVEQPDGGAGPDRDRRPDAGRDERHGVVLGRPPGVRNRAADRHPRPAQAVRLGGEDRS